MEETNVTMTAEEMQGEPAAKENETKAEKFIRIGEYRMNKAVDAIGRLENLANRGSYEYTQEQVDAMCIFVGTPICKILQSANSIHRLIHAVLTNTDKLLRLCLIFLCRRLTLHFLCCHCYICFFHVFSSIF